MYICFLLVINEARLVIIVDLALLLAFNIPADDLHLMYGIPLRALGKSKRRCPCCPLTSHRTQQSLLHRNLAQECCHTGTFVFVPLRPFEFI